ncbi:MULTISPECIES: hypothetical protein [Pseudoalteromonas]|uniref:hypothetical protein n=1 Tax=Pseudoalteromonas TaxID=53246 RepID=UPI001B36049A|nr:MULTISPECIES: hypothetical protein [Pseudoalteromonas]MBQ4838815.1 hypothetical protein [Pseudoalteromonas luteoviolacea]MCG7548559.1 hypothetical protein [Pseudoalteromonas sp. Of7M-16]
MIEKIREAVERLNDPAVVHEQQIEIQTRLKNLVVQYGIENVAAASGLAQSSLQTYLRSKRPNINRQTVAQAEQVFKMVCEAV